MRPDCMSEDEYQIYCEGMTELQIERNICNDCSYDYARRMAAMGKCYMYTREISRKRVSFNDFLNRKFKEEHDNSPVY